MAKKIVIEETKGTKRATTKKPTVVNRVTNRKALGSSPIKSDNEISDDDFAKKIEDAKKKIVWLEPQNGQGRNVDADVSITKTKDTSAKPKWNFTLRGDYAYTFGKMIQVGTYENKLFFQEVKSFGYFITVQDRGGKKKRKTASGYFKLPICKESMYVEKFLGNHTMHYDDLLELYYIEVKEV